MNRRFEKPLIAGWAASVAVLLLLTGCVTQVEEVEPLARTRLIVTRAGGVATLQWQSEIGMTYTLMYADSRKPGTAWRGVPGVHAVPGNGDLMKYEDKLPYGRDRHYRIQATPRKPASGTRR